MCPVCVPAVVVAGPAYETSKVIDEIAQMQLPHGRGDLLACLEKISDLLKLERDPTNEELVNEVFRAVHTLKGTSGLFDMPGLTRVVHAGEDLLGAVRSHQLTLDSAMVDALLDGLDKVSAWVDELERHSRLPDEAEGIDAGGIGDVVGRRNEILKQGLQFLTFYVGSANVAAAGNLDSGGKVPEHQAKRCFVLRDVVGQRTRHRVLQQHLIGFQPVAINGFHLRRVEIHGHNADGHQYAQDHVKDGNARRNGHF
jgi:HPt (histidine-containing phosphotransfer) domain-containing protein